METPPPTTLNTIRLSFIRVLILTVLLIGIANVHCQAKYPGLIFKNRDGSKWEFASNSFWTGFLDWNKNNDKVKNHYTKGDYIVNKDTGRFKIYDKSTLPDYSVYARENYDDLMVELLKHYPNCNPVVWQEYLPYFFYTYIEFDDQSEIKEVKER